jgi:hypothetical protein
MCEPKRRSLCTGICIFGVRRRRILEEMGSWNGLFRLLKIDNLYDVLQLLLSNARTPMPFACDAIQPNTTS